MGQFVRQEPPTCIGLRCVLSLPHDNVRADRERRGAYGFRAVGRKFARVDANPAEQRWRSAILGLTVLWGMVAVTGAQWGNAVLVGVFLVFAVLLTIGHVYIADIVAGLYLKKHNVYNIEIAGKGLELINRGLLTSSWRQDKTQYRFGNQAVLESILEEKPEDVLTQGQ